MILCVTLNPLVDTSFFVDEIRPVYRTEVRRIAHVAGGKGNNVARALVGMGRPARVFTVLGGRTGQHLADLLEEDGADRVLAWLSGETRLSITVVDRAYQQRGYWAPPQAWQEADVATVRQLFPKALEGVQAMCMCGSSPGPLADPLYPEWLRAARQRGLPTLLDTYGPCLAEGLAAAPTVVKVNRAEAAAWLGRPLETRAEQVDALAALRQAGAQWAILTLGEQGALFACPSGCWAGHPPQVAVVNPISSGDAMTAGIMAGLVEGSAPLDCFRLGMAAAVANATSWEVCRLMRPEVEAMLPRIDIVPIGEMI